MYIIKKAVYQLRLCQVKSSLCFLYQSHFSNMTSTQLEHLKLEKCKHFMASPYTSTKNGLISMGKPCFSTTAEPILVQARDPSKIALNIVSSIEDKRFEDAWKGYEKHILMDGFPRKSILNKLVTCLAESCDVCWIEKAFDIVNHVFNEKKYDLLDIESLIFLSFILAKSQQPVHATNALRILVEIDGFPTAAAWSGIVGHLCLTANGAFLAADLVLEIGYLFKDNRVDPRKKSNRALLAMKPNSFIFNVTLTGCILHGITRKGEQLLELMPRVGLKPDADLLIVMAHIYEKNGQRNELIKLKRFIDEACGLTLFQFQQFYNCLLSSHLKFCDLDSSTGLILDMLRRASEAKHSLEAAKSVLEVIQDEKVSHLCNFGKDKRGFTERFALLKSQAPTFTEFTKDRNFSKLEAEARESLCFLSDRLKGDTDLVGLKDGILHPTERIYAKLVRGFLDMNRTSDLASFLIKVSKEESPVSTDTSIVTQVLDACISLGMLTQAHDLLDEMRFSGVKLRSSIYSSLLKAYCKENRQAEIISLLKETRKSGIQLDTNCYESLIQSRVLQNDSGGALLLFKEMKLANMSKSDKNEFDKLVEGCSELGDTSLMSSLLDEIKYKQKVDCGAHDWNSVIHFFCKKKMMHDAQKALSKMKALGHIPNAHTFHSLVTGYAAIGGKYVEVTDLFGEMKVVMSSGVSKFDQELFDSFLYCFVRGGFFLRAMEVIGMMEAENMFIDKYKYKALWLKYHRTLYKGKAPKIQTEAQYKRREAGLSFRKWIGLT